jgi:hypothetical protein
MSSNIYNIDIKYFCIIFLFFIYYIYGLVLSDIVDYVFPDYNEDLEEWRIALELIGEICIVYLVYFMLKKYSELIIDSIFKSISKKVPYYLNQLLIISFSFGIFKHLKKSNEKINYFKQKFTNSKSDS